MSGRQRVQISVALAAPDTYALRARFFTVTPGTGGWVGFYLV